MAHQTSQLLRDQFASCSREMGFIESKAILGTLILPANALLFTADAYSIYANIKTDPALESTASHIRNNIPAMDCHYNEPNSQYYPEGVRVRAGNSLTLNFTGPTPDWLSFSPTRLPMKY
eukprot:scaffold74968_cov57-Cyclotella_meneghiniana.AAC.3